ncbi:hypothetical protein R3P38DRAFT_2361292, partial [Favolaschia claudopus]
MLSDDDASDVDQLSPDNEASPSKKRNGKKRLAGGKTGVHFLLRGKLNRPRHSEYTTEALYKQVHLGDIDLNPPYQREVVWPEVKQIALIDSILRCYNVPPIVFSVSSYEDGTEIRTCIDGKQRLTSIQKFVDGLVCRPCGCPSSYTEDKYWYRDNPSAKWKRAKKLLPDEVRKQFDSRTLLCTEYQDLLDAEEREMFARVQKGVVLTPSENLGVITSPRAEYIKHLQQKFLKGDDAGLNKDVLAWDTVRGSDFRCLTQTVHCIAIHPKQSSFKAMEKWLQNPTPLTPDFASDIENTYRIFEALVRDPHNGTHFPGIAPIEFIMIGILVHRHKARLSLEGLGRAVGEMRKDVRTRHIDIRINSSVSRTMMAFIDGYLGSALGPGETSAVDSVARVAGAKRKGRDDGDGDGEANSDNDNDEAQQAAPRKRQKSKHTPTVVAALPTPPASVSASTTHSVGAVTNAQAPAQHIPPSRPAHSSPAA